MDCSTVCLQGQACYVEYRGFFDGTSHYIIGTRNSPESPVAVAIDGIDSNILRLEAVKKGLAQILAGGTYY
ncbi:MAG: hypothetical protein AABY16_01830 [Nanoarchaeota archaeon]